MATLIALASLCFGCAKSSPLGKANYVPVEGVVTIDGQPAAGVDVTLRPKIVNPNIEDESIATTDSEGKFSIMTGKKVGAPEGDYFVGFSKAEGETQTLMKYCRPLDSGFTISVAEGMEQPTFDLKLK